MLHLHPNCEHCDKDLPANATDAYICSFECTFCEGCALELFENTCPNCGGGFTQRPVRPSMPHKTPWWLGDHPASSKRRLRPKDIQRHQKFAQDLKGIPPNKR
ncbi:DUF1272 domain-containing protein [Flexibacterium corallicola]|uniref:DUF1272 domain-containing protein n=1 Tax=Flexibacterium corallicola TaxID=3037259 RepID=UPI00286F7EDD|nr:DUF1272 domain-containing protein [Pseudovibrio sp. M1P-2-3]